MKLDHWSVVSSADPYKAPEQCSSRLRGIVYGNPKFGEGCAVTTSQIVGKRGGKVVTKSGSEYELGAVDAAYHDAFPGAFNRLLTSLTEINYAQATSTLNSDSDNQQETSDK